jgi:hypothetical protein
LINAASSNDPLALWCKYIAKLEEQERPSENLSAALRQCTLLYSQDERYIHDERMVRIWMRYISSCSDKLVSAQEPRYNVLKCDALVAFQDKFRYLESNKLCTFSAIFWLEFSSHHGEELCSMMDSYATLRRGLVSVGP